MVSHLSTLIERVKTAEEVASMNEMSEGETRLFLGGKLLNLVEYMRYWDNYGDVEVAGARGILERYGMDPEMDDAEMEDFLRNLYGDPMKWSRFCVTCGKALSNPTSVERGQGPTCRRKTRRAITSLDIAAMIRKERVKDLGGNRVDEEDESEA